MLQEECSTRSARPLPLRAAATHSQRYLLALPTPRTLFSHFGTRRHLEAGHRSRARAKKLEIPLTHVISSISVFLIDKFLPILRTDFRASSFRSPLACPDAGRATRHPALLSNRNTKKLEITLSHRKQRIGHFLIATFRALFCPTASSPSAGNPLASPYVLNPAFGGRNLPCRP